MEVPRLYARFVWPLLILFGITNCKCPDVIVDLFAYTNPSSSKFTDSWDEDLFDKYISSDFDEGSVCRWRLTASGSDEVVKLKFSNFDLIQGEDGDCLYIYDGPGKDDELLDEICSGVPKTYESDDRNLFMVYKRGEVEGERGFTFTYEAEEVMTNARIIRIAGIIGGVLAAIGLTYLLVRATNCFSCMRSKNTTDDHLASANTDERDRLTTTSPATAVSTEVTNQTGNSPTVVISEPEDSGASDSDSLPEFNQPPPSYESLYLNESGEEAISPPDYSPPKFHREHPPRRVHTFN